MKEIEIMKIKSTSMAFIIIFLLVLVQVAYADGRYNIMFLIYIFPLFIPFFISSLLYGLIASAMMRSMPMGVRIFGGSLICFIVTIILSLGPLAIIFGTIYAFIAPYSHLRKSLKEQKITEEKFNTLRTKLIKFRTSFVLIAAILGVGWQIFAPVYFNSHLIKMLKNPALSIKETAAEKLIALKNQIKRHEYSLQLRQIIVDENESRWFKGLVTEILAEWKDIDAIPIILMGLRSDELYEYKSIDALKKITGENFSKLEEWENWWKESQIRKLEGGQVESKLDN